MEVARDMTRIALPFVAGIALTSWCGPFLCIRPYLSTGIAFALILVTTAAIRSYNRHILQLAICLCLITCGILCGLTSELTHTGSNYTGSLSESIRSLGVAAGEAIDGIGFRNPDTNTIIRALILGDRTDIPDHITEAFRLSGASHILALSGFHLGIIYGILTKMLSISGNSPEARILRSSFIVLACGIYTMITGAGASTVRAFLFILLGESARISGRSRDIKTILMSSLLIHLVISPYSFDDVGFQLSYAAIAGIAFIFPWLSGFWPESPKVRKGFLRRIWDSAALSISCQITTGPLAYLYFGTFPKHFLLTNLMALPLTGLIIPMSLLTICLESFNLCPEIITRATEALITALTEALAIISEM